MKQTNVIAISTDYNYIGYTIKLLDSIAYNKINADVFLRAIDFNIDQQHRISRMLDNMPVKINIHFDNPNYSNKKSILKDVGCAVSTVYGVNIEMTGSKNLNRLLYSPRSVYACHSRFKSINSLLEHGYETILCLDADTIVNNNIDHIFEWSEYDLYVIPTFKDDETFYFHNEGFLLMNNNQRTIKYFNDVHQYIFTGDRYLEWNIDTTALTDALSSNVLKIGTTGEEYKDKKHTPSSYMWSGDGVNKYQHKFITHERVD